MGKCRIPLAKMPFMEDPLKWYELTISLAKGKKAKRGKVHSAALSATRKCVLFTADAGLATPLQQCESVDFMAFMGGPAVSMDVFSGTDS